MRTGREGKPIGSCYSERVSKPRGALFAGGSRRLSTPVFPRTQVRGGCLVLSTGTRRLRGHLQPWEQARASAEASPA